MINPRVSFVIPTLNEAANLPRLISDLKACDVASEIVVADGGSSDDTREIALDHDALVTQCEAGRARQMNAGAATATGDWLCFLHADVRLDEEARAALDDAVTSGIAEAAVWRLRIDSPNPLYRIVEMGARLRDMLLGLPYGDQGLLVQSTEFREVGGYPDLPLMEDVALIKKLRARHRVRRLKACVSVSPRRWEKRGIIRQTVLNGMLITAYLVGVNPRRIARLYPVH